MVENVSIESGYGTADSPELTFFHLRPTRVLLRWSHRFESMGVMYGEFR